jgi:hypothetical protein
MPSENPLILNLHISSPIYKFESGTLKLWETIDSKASGSISSRETMPYEWINQCSQFKTGFKL